MKILLIDDSAADAALVKALLLASNFRAELRTEDNLHDGIECAHRFEPDMILLDLGMPPEGIEGTIATIPELADIGPVLILSGFEPEKYMIKCHEAGAIAFLYKQQFLKVGTEAFLHWALLTARLNWKRLHVAA